MDTTKLKLIRSLPNLKLTAKNKQQKQKQK